MITEEITIKHLDIVLKISNSVEKFSVLDILKKYGAIDFNKDNERSDFIKLKMSVEQLGKTYEYFENVENRPGFFNLTETGIKAKKLGGHLKYQNSLKSSLTKYQKIYIPFFIIFGLIGSYKTIFPSVSKAEYENLKSQHLILKSDFDNLKLRYDSIVELTSKPTLKKLNDTLQTKNLNDLKTD